MVFINVAPFCIEFAGQFDRWGDNIRRLDQKSPLYRTRFPKCAYLKSNIARFLRRLVSLIEEQTSFPQKCLNSYGKKIWEYFSSSALSSIAYYLKVVCYFSSCTVLAGKHCLFIWKVLNKTYNNQTMINF